MDYLIIKENAKWKAVWDIVINLFVAFSTFSTIYQVCFNVSTALGLDIFTRIVESSFFIDIIMNFLTEYRDPETYETVRSIPKIAKRYVFKGWFIIDFVGVIPF